MHNFIKSRFAICFLLVTFCFNAFAQPCLPFGTASPSESWGQLLNTSNVYKNSTACSAFLDSGTNGTIWLMSNRQLQGKVNADTFVPAPINGQGNLSISAVAWRASATQTVVPNVVLNLYGSDDGVFYQPVAGAATFTLQPTLTYTTSVGSPASCNWQLTYKPARFIAVKSVFSLDSASVRAQYYMTKNTSYSLPPNSR